MSHMRNCDKENSIRTSRVVLETTTECYESTCEWSPVLITGSCSTEEPDDCSDEFIDINFCDTDQKIAKSETENDFQQQNPDGHIKKLRSQPHADVAIDFQRPEPTKQASGNWPETLEPVGSSNATARSVRSRMRNSSSGQIRKETAESFHALSTDTVGSDDSDSNSEVSIRNSKVLGKATMFYPTLESDMSHSDEAEDIGKCFVIAFDVAMQSETSQDMLDNKILNIASTAEGKANKFFTADCHLPVHLLAVKEDEAVQGGGDSADGRRYLGARQPDGNTEPTLYKFAVDSSSSSGAKVHEFSLTGGSMDDKDDNDSYNELEENQDIIDFAAVEQPEERSAEESGRILFEALGSHEEKFSSSSTSSEHDDANFLFGIDSTAAVERCEVNEKSLIKFGVSAEFDTLSDCQRSIHSIARDAELLQPSYNPEDSQDLVVVDTAAVNNSYTHNVCDTTNDVNKVEARIVCASEVDNDGVINHDENSDECEVSGSESPLAYSVNYIEQLESRMNFFSSTVRACHSTDEIAAKRDNEHDAPDVGLDYVSSSPTSADSDCEIDQQEAKKPLTLWCRNRIEAKN